jgi:hypothetical protein
MMRRLAINLLGFIIAVFRVMRRRKVSSAIPAVIAEPVREARTVEWCRSQPTINSDTLIDAVQKVRGTITHCGAVEARAVLDGLEREAESHPQGVPGHIVADARLRFDQLMRSNLQ